MLEIVLLIHEVYVVWRLKSTHIFFLYEMHNINEGILTYIYTPQKKGIFLKLN